MTTADKFKILTKFVKDLSSETADAQTYLFVKDNISKYHLNIEIKSKPVKKTVNWNQCNFKVSGQSAQRKTISFWNYICFNC